MRKTKSKTRRVILITTEPPKTEPKTYRVITKQETIPAIAGQKSIPVIVKLIEPEKPKKSVRTFKVVKA